MFVLESESVSFVRRVDDVRFDLAEEAGIHENYVSELELGRKEICLRSLQTLARAFGMTAAELLNGVE